MTKPVKFAHAVYRTRRFEAMIAWRAKVFEAEVVDVVPARLYRG